MSKDDIFDGNSVFVVSQDTLDSIMKEEREFARTQPNPIEYLMNVSKMPFIVDNSLSFGIVEIYYKDKYIEDNNE